MQVHNFVGGQCGFTILLEDDYAKSNKADKKKVQVVWIHR